MTSAIPYSLVFLGIILTTSLSVLGEDDPCFTKQTCQSCVVTKTNITVGDEGGNNGTCIYVATQTGSRCIQKVSLSEGVISAIYVVAGCANDPPTTPPPAPAANTTTTAAPPTTTNATTTTVAPTPTPTTNGTTIPTTTAPPTNATTTVPTTTTPPSNGTTVPTTTPAPSNGTTTLPPTPTPTPTPAPKKGGFAWGEFIGGIVFAIAISSLAYLIWRFYKARLDRNYHTFSNPTF